MEHLTICTGANFRLYRVLFMANNCSCPFFIVFKYLIVLRSDSIDRWSVRHMLLEVLVTALLIYLQFLDRSVGLWAMSAAIVSLVGEFSFFYFILFYSNLFYCFSSLSHHLQLEPPVVLQYCHTFESNAEIASLYLLSTMNDIARRKQFIFYLL
jgi:hypothetical protein